jgi:long-subunit acyl-CoA synthetase (AMP-forming)
MRLKAASPLIGHAVAIGDRRAYNTALIVLDPDSLGLYAYKNGIEEFSVAGMSADGGVLAEIAAAVATANEHLSRVEQVKRFMILPDVWEPGSELVTPTLKLRRKPIAEIYEEEIEGMYAP